MPQSAVAFNRLANDAVATAAVNAWLGDAPAPPDAPGAPGRCKPRVLVLADANAGDVPNATLMTALTRAGLQAQLVDRGAADSSGTPSEAAFVAVLVTPGRTYDKDMLLDG